MRKRGDRSQAGRAATTRPHARPRAGPSYNIGGGRQARNLAGHAGRPPPDRPSARRRLNAFARRSIVGSSVSVSAAMFRRAIACASLALLLAAPLAASDRRSDARAQVEFGIDVAQRGLVEGSDLPLGDGPSRSIRPTRRRSTIWRSPTSTKGCSRRREDAYETGAQARAEQRAASSRTTSCSRKSMTARTASTPRLASCWCLPPRRCTTFYEIPIETPIQPKLDVSAFQRVLVAGFIAGGTDEVDANLETVRLLRSQLRTKSDLKVIEADVLPLVEIAVGQRAEERRRRQADSGATAPGWRLRCRRRSRTRRTSRPTSTIFANVEYWKKLGEEYQNPLIVTGTVLFTPHSRSGFVQREQEVVRLVRPAPRRARCAPTWSARASSSGRSSSSSTAGPAPRCTRRRSASRSSTTRSRTRRPCRPTSS